MKRILNSHNFKVAEKLFQTLGYIFAKPKDPVKNNEPTPFILFLATTVTMNTSDRPNVFDTRLKEHQKVVSFCKKENSALSEHTCLTNLKIGWDKSKNYHH